VKFNEFAVALEQEYELDGYMMRKLALKRGGEQRPVVQLQMTSWPDHGVPNSADSFLLMHKAYRQIMEQAGPSGPAVVHCSAGVGRSGTFLCLDVVYDLLLEGRMTLDIVKCVAGLRQSRNLMVQSLSQFVFLYDACSTLVVNLLREAPVARPSPRAPQQMQAAPHRAAAAQKAYREEQEALQLATAISLSEAEGRAGNQHLSTGARSSAASMLPSEHTLLYMGSQKVKRASGAPVVNAALTTVLKRNRVSRPLVLRVDSAGVELCELQRADGKFHPVKLISFFQSGIVPSHLTALVEPHMKHLQLKKSKAPKVCFVCFITLVETTSEHVCHCFLAQNASVVSGTERDFWPGAVPFCFCSLTSLPAPSRPTMFARAWHKLLIWRRACRGSTRLSGGQTSPMAWPLQKSRMSTLPWPCMSL
jgi:hypothetical protein